MNILTYFRLSAWYNRMAKQEPTPETTENAAPAPWLIETSNVSKIYEIATENIEAIDATREKLATEGVTEHTKELADKRTIVVSEKHLTIKDMMEMSADSDALEDKFDLILDWLKPHLFTPEHFDAIDRCRADLKRASEKGMEAALSMAAKQRHIKHGKREDV